MRLISIRYRHFKGLQEYTLTPGGDDLTIYGANGCYKSTLHDGWRWLLWGKNAADKADFNVKTLTETGEALHELEHEVEGVVELDGERVSLTRCLTEKWEAKRGSADKAFTGHQTTYQISGVPKPQKDFDAFVAGLCKPEPLRILSDPTYFNERLKWVDRRAVLLEVCGDVTDADVIASDPDLAALPGILGKRSLQDHKDAVQALKKKVAEKKKELPIQIREANHNLPAAAQANGQAGLTTRLDALRQQRAGKEAEKARIETGGGGAELQKRIAEIEAQQAAVKARLQTASNEAVQAERVQANGVNGQIDAENREIQNLRKSAQEAGREAETLEAKMAVMRAEWDVVCAREFADIADNTCAACGQAIPEETVEEVRAAALAEFNAQKSADLEANQTGGKQLKGERDKRQLAKQGHEAGIKAAGAALATLQAQATEIQGRIAKLQATDVTQEPEYIGCVIEREQLQEQIAGLQDGNTEVLAKVAAEIAALDGQIGEAERSLSDIRQREAGLRRIDELKVQERQLAAEFERLEAEIYLCEQFVRAKVAMLTDRINSRFELARFKLFETQINGGLTECCETTYQGVPYNSDLNTGARINVGLDIIRTLSEHYGFQAPIWVDNRESVTELIPMDAQIISLIVQPQSKCSACGAVFATPVRPQVDGVPVPDWTPACPACKSVDVAEHQGLRVEREPAHQYAQEAI